MSQLFSTELVPVADRRDAWHSRARQICGECRFQFPKRYTFHGSIDCRKVGGLDFTHFSSSPLSFMKFPSETARAENRFCIVVTQLKGAQRYRQGGAAVVLHPGDSTMIDSELPWSSDSPDECARLYLRVPGWLMENRLRIGKLPIVQRISGEAGLGATLFGLATTLYHEADALSLDEGAAAVEAYFDILSACVRETDADSGTGHRAAELSSRIEQFIETHLADPTLGPAEIATAAGVSVRHLHRVFSRKGRTVGDWIRERRLEHCRSDLEDSRLRQRTITDIAFYWGFSESAHFSRSFKQQFGMCPRTFRSQVWTRLWNASKREGAQDLLVSGTTGKPN